MRLEPSLLDIRLVIDRHLYCTLHNKENLSCRCWNIESFLTLANRQNCRKSSVEECILWLYNIELRMPIQRKLTPPGLLFSRFCRLGCSLKVEQGQNLKKTVNNETFLKAFHTRIVKNHYIYKNFIFFFYKNHVWSY